jgi:oligoendopeptidase F
VKQRRAMLAAKVEDMINTVVRQIAFYTFERKVHSRAAQGRAHRGQAQARSG